MSVSEYPNPTSAYPDPTAEDLASPEFEAVWQAIRTWDLSRSCPVPGDGHRMYAAATGNDVMHILKSLSDAGLKVVSNG